MHKEVTILLPTYNEAGNIGLLIEELEERLVEALGSNVYYIVVDDNSSDETVNVVKELQQTNQRISLIERTADASLGKSVLEGLRHVKTEYIMIMDTDFNHPPRYCFDMIVEAKKGHAVIGSRYVAGGGMDYGMFRYVCSAIVQGIMRIITGVKCKELLSGFACIHYSDIVGLLAHEEAFNGHGEFFIYMLRYLQQKGVEIREVPVVYDKRRYGESKTKLSQYAISVIRTAWKTRFYNFR